MPTGRIERELSRFPFIAAFAHTQDETNRYADLLRPEATDLESLTVAHLRSITLATLRPVCAGSSRRSS